MKKQGVLAFAKTWYHETIHSIHAVSGFTMKLFIHYTNSGFGEGAVEMATGVSEFFAHLKTDIMAGENLKFSPAFTTYYPGYYINSIILNR